MFHVARRDLGPSLVLEPRIPINASKTECQKTPRVCFAPTVEQCVIGIVGYAIRRDITYLGAFLELANSQWCPTVYYTHDDLYCPDPTSDFLITEEHWALDPVSVERIGYINCLDMVRKKIITVCDHPTYVSYPDHELVCHLSDTDRDFILQAVGEE